MVRAARLPAAVCPPSTLGALTRNTCTSLPRIGSSSMAAAKAGEATAVVADRARETVEAVKPAVSTATKAAGKAVNKGAYATGRQIKRASGMFSAFKEEYDKARHDD